ncbi:hypothetical protein [Haladaptatus sp. NG-SE-30]
MQNRAGATFRLAGQPAPARAGLAASARLPREGRPSDRATERPKGAKESVGEARGCGCGGAVAVRVGMKGAAVWTKDGDVPASERT